METAAPSSPNLSKFSRNKGFNLSRNLSGSSCILEVLGRLIRSRQLPHPIGLPVYVARRPPAPFCETPRQTQRRLTQTAYSNSSSNSSSRCSNKRSVLSIGADVVMSTPAAFNVSSGNFEPPERRKSRYASTLPDSWASTCCESATAAEIPVAYL